MRLAALFPTSVTRPPLVTRQNKHKLCIPRSGFLPRAAATAATDSALLAQANPLNLSFQDLLRKGPSRQAALPEPPTESTFAAVIPWLVKLAVAESKSWWRIALAFMCLVGSKFAVPLEFLLCLTCGNVKNLHPAASVQDYAHTGARGSNAAAKHMALLGNFNPIDMITIGAHVGMIACPCSIRKHHSIRYGLCDMLKHTFKELQAPLFTPVSQAAARRVAYHTFSHVLDLDIKYHLDRRTGRLSRILERGTRSIQMLYRAVIFTFVPTALELLIVCGVLAKAFNPLVGGLVLATFGAYVAWSVTLTQMAAAARKHVNTLDNATSAKAVDALLSYETVALFNNQKLEVCPVTTTCMASQLCSNADKQLPCYEDEDKVAQYNAYLKEYFKATVHTERLAAVLNAGQAIILAGGLTAIMVTALQVGKGGAVSAGDLVMIQGLLLQLWAPLQFLGWFYRELRSAMVDMEDFFAVLRTRSALRDGNQVLPASYQPASPPTLHQSIPALQHPTLVATNGNGRYPNSQPAAHSVSNGSYGSSSSSNGHSPSRSNNGVGHHTPSKDLTVASSSSGPVGKREADALTPWSQGLQQGQEGHERMGAQGLFIQLQDVKFGYSPERQVGGQGEDYTNGAAVDLTDKVESENGKSCAIGVTNPGSSGSGKSTILKLLTRLYDTDSGEVLLNGVNAKDLRLESLRGAVAVVPQDTMLFNDTIMQNIRYGRPESSEEEVVAAAKLAHLHDAVVRMPNAYSTVVGERGLKLSGGEKQRVAIARAFLRQPRLLICDEATSALDSATEAQIMASLNELAAGRTSVFVAHRLSTIRSCDTIVVLRDGLVAEQGSHEALMAQPEGLYRAMWELQAAEQQEDEGEEGAVAMGGEDLGGVSSLMASSSALGGLGPEAGSAECVQGSSQEANDTEEMKAETELGLGWLPSPSSSSSTSSFSRDSSSLLSGSVNGHSATSGNGSGSNDGSHESLLHTAALRVLGAMAARIFTFKSMHFLIMRASPRETAATDVAQEHLHKTTAFKLTHDDLDVGLSCGTREGDDGQHVCDLGVLPAPPPSPAQPSPAQPSPAQPSPAQPSPAQPSPAQPSPAQPSPAQPSPAQPSPAQPSPAQPSPAQPSPAQPSPAQPSPAQPSPAQPSPAQPSPAQPSPAQPSPAQPSPAQPSPAQPSPAQPSPAQPSPAQPSPAQPSPAQPSPAQPSPAQPSPAQPSPAQPSPAQPSPAQPSPAQPSPAQPSPAQPSPAQPSPAQPSPAQPSPAQPSPAQPSPAQPSPAQPSPAQPSPAQPSPAQPSPAQPSPAQPSPAQPSPAQPSPAQPSPAQPSPAQPSPAQPSPAQPSPAQPSPAQPSPAQPSPAQPSPAQPSPAQPSPAQPSPAQPSPAQPSPAQPSPAQPSPAQPSPAQPSPAQPSPAQPSPAQPSPAQPSPAQPSPAQPSPAQPSPAQPSPAQPSPAQPSPAQPSPAQPSPAQPSPAQPSPAQPSPAQPSPAQPSPAQPSPAQPSPAQPSPAQPSPAQPSPAQPSPAQPQPSPAQPSPAQPSPAQPSPAQPSPAQPSPAQPSPAQPSPAQPSPAQPSPAQPSPAQPSPAQPSPAQPSPAQPSPAQPSPAQPSPAQPSPAQPSPAQPSPAQPSPAQPSPAQPSPAQPSP
ncbi:hypothetical protein QJQ45_022301 [Haematococcus lacustris]|nr:hypothetical protein QJQ45_022301 [Haematococcus lacustris]